MQSTQDIIQATQQSMTAQKKPFWLRLLPGRLANYFHDKETLRDSTNTFVWLSITNFGVRLFSAVIVSVLAARILGPVQFGQLSYILSFTALFLPLVKLGLDTVFIQSFTSKADDSNSSLGSGLVVRLFAGVVAWVLTMIAIVLLRPHDIYTQVLIGLVAFGNIFTAFETIELWFQAKLRFQTVARVKIIVFCILLICKALALLIFKSLEIVAILYMLENIVLAVGLYALAIRSDVTLSIQNIKEHIRVFLPAAVPLTFSALAITAYGKFDQLLLNYHLGSESLAQYVISLSIIEVLVFIPLMASKALAPIILHSNTQNSDEFEKQMVLLYRLMFVLSFAAWLGVTFVIRPILPIVYGAEYAVAASLLWLLPARLVFANIGIARALFVTSKGIFTYDLFTNVVGFLVTVICNLVLIPKFGLFGVLYSSFIALLISTFVLDCFHPILRKNLRLELYALFTLWKLNPEKK